SLAGALALGFCAADAAALAKMAATQALQNADAAGRGAGPVRPMRGVARPAGLVALLRPHAGGGPPAFAPPLHPPPGGCSIVDSAAWVERLLAAGARTVQLRIKDAASRTLSSEVRRSVHAAREHGAQLFVNDHWALALEHGAYGVHLGQEDLARADIAALRA